VWVSQWRRDEQLLVTSVVVKLLVSVRVYSVVTGEKRAWVC
jgi:hypothetical protein